MSLRLPKTVFAFFVFTAAGVAAAVLTMPDREDPPSNELDSAGLTQPEVTNVSTVASTLKQASGLISIDQFLTIPSNRRPVEVNLEAIDANWDLAYAPMLLESLRFMSARSRPQVIALLENKTKQNFGSNLDQWRQWIWKQKFKPHPDLAELKTKLYQKIDPRFGEYFSDADGATIRLDEIRWGGVVRDGIPPLNKPQMISPAQAKYLGDSDVVFGVEINGDARCYPKRILAWHEMFKDTIGGESVCGVY